MVIRIGGNNLERPTLKSSAGIDLTLPPTFSKQWIPERRKAKSLNGRTAKQPKSAFHVRSQNRKSLSNTSSSGSSQSVGVSAAYENCPSAKTNGFDPITPTSDTAIHQDFNLAIHRSDDFLEGPHRCWR